MKTNKILLTAAVAGLGFGLGGTAQAKSVNDIVGDIISQYGAGTPVTFEDADRSNIFDANQNGLLDVGDKIYGVFNIDSIKVGGSVQAPLGFFGNNELKGVYSLEIATKAGDATQGFTWTYKVDTNFASTYGDGAMIAFFENSDLTQKGDFAAGTDASFTNGTQWGVLGMTGEGFEFFDTATRDGFKSDVIAGAISVPFTSVFAGGNFSLNLLDLGLAANDLLLEANEFGTQFKGSFSLLGHDADSPDWDISSKTSFSANVVPVPASAWMAFATIGLMGLGYYGKRRRDAVA